jgi:hypothetical protein
MVVLHDRPDPRVREVLKGATLRSVVPEVVDVTVWIDPMTPDATPLADDRQ